MGRKLGSKNKSIVQGGKNLSSNSLYKATLKTVGRTFTTVGKTPEEAIGKIKISGGAKAISVLTVETVGKDGRKQEKILSGATSHALFSDVGPTMKLIHLKKTLALFDL